MGEEIKQSETSTRKIRILLIDDEPAIVKILGRMLQLAGFEVSSAMDGEAGLAKARAELPDAIVLDLMLPKINGFEVCAALKNDEATQHIVIVIFSARGRQEEQRCLELGASAFFNKLDPATELIKTIKALCAQSGQEKQ